MKRKISIVCLLLLCVYCLSAVCAADLNQTTDDIKTNEEEDDSKMVLEDNIAVDISGENVTADEDNQVADDLGDKTYNETFIPADTINCNATTGEQWTFDESFLSENHTHWILPGTPIPMKIIPDLLKPTPNPTPDSISTHFDDNRGHGLNMHEESRHSRHGDMGPFNPSGPISPVGFEHILRNRW